MVDPKETTEQTSQLPVSAERLDRKVWIKPRLDIVSLDETQATPPTTPGADGSNSLS